MLVCVHGPSSIYLFHSTETLVRQYANGSSVDALLGMMMSTLLKSELDVASMRDLPQHWVNWVIGMATPLVH